MIKYLRITLLLAVLATALLLPATASAESSPATCIRASTWRGKGLWLRFNDLYSDYEQWHYVSANYQVVWACGLETHGGYAPYEVSWVNPPWWRYCDGPKQVRVYFGKTTYVTMQCTIGG